MAIRRTRLRAAAALLLAPLAALATTGSGVPSAGQTCPRVTIAATTAARSTSRRPDRSSG
jgi:hypothetical protein